MLIKHLLMIISPLNNFVTFIKVCWGLLPLSLITLFAAPWLTWCVTCTAWPSPPRWRGWPRVTWPWSGPPTSCAQSSPGTPASWARRTSGTSGSRPGVSSSSSPSTRSSSSPRETFLFPPPETFLYPPPLWISISVLRDTRLLRSSLQPRWSLTSTAPQSLIREASMDLSTTSDWVQDFCHHHDVTKTSGVSGVCSQRWSIIIIRHLVSSHPPESTSPVIRSPIMKSNIYPRWAPVCCHTSGIINWGHLQTIFWEVLNQVYFLWSGK